MDELQSLHAEMAKAHLGPLWASIQQLNTVEPVSRPVPYLWKSQLIRHYLEEAGRRLQVGKDAERRAVFLINPGMQALEPVGWGGATQTLYVAVQAVRPGEVAPAHRHTTSALRFVLEGHGAMGTVDGERLHFAPGDYLITPGGSWHDHMNPGNETVLWMDCLDTPFTLYLGVCFTEFLDQVQQSLEVPDNYSVLRYGGGMVRPISDRNRKRSPLTAYRWQPTEQALQRMAALPPDACDAYAVEYINPATGGDADGRIGARMQCLPPGFAGKAHRHVHSTVYCAYRGQGYTVINGVRFEWQAGDFFVVPTWAWHEHVNTGSEPAYLFSVNDLPIMEAFDFEREEMLTAGDGHQEVRETFVPLLPDDVPSAR
ncbi:cupin domain-containing protein [Alicyclobacillus kakegawensis]|uniref:cupin domain-containing protein n=1 Tax=Alicyclobacillus kakegawensis TaxID=392012 RepID=UPI000A460BDA|nr:cupin domain-containing protein [Alicyclobacillus kakegawensis]